MINNKKIYHFYHIYADGSWMLPVSQQIKALKVSKLIDHIDKLKIGIVGNDKNFNFVKDYLDNENINYEIVDHQHGGWEQVTLNKLYRFAQDNDGIVFYGHTKGASRGGHPQDEWRETMIYHNTIRWKECVEALNTYDTAGCFWMSPLPQMTEHVGHKYFYAGTYWWANLEYIKTLPPPGMDHRHRAEGWIGLNHNIKPFSFYPGWPGYWVNLSEHLVDNYE